MSDATILQAAVLGACVLGPGVNGWAQWCAVAEAPATWAFAPTALPAPTLLPPAERRRASRLVKAALHAGTEAIAQAGLRADRLPSVFASSGGDGANCHALCELLAGEDKQISPTRFHNSVHNAASGYWSIAAQAMTPVQVVAAYDGSFAMGLLEALSLVQALGGPVLFIACDSEYPEPLHAKRPITDVSAIALVLAPVAANASAPVLRCDGSRLWGVGTATGLPPAWPEALRALPEQLPPWRGAALMAALALGDAEQQDLQLYVDETQTLAVQVRGRLHRPVAGAGV